MTNESVNRTIKNTIGRNKPEIAYYSITVDNFIKNDKYIINQDNFSRKYIWNVERASLFIESILLGFPVPPIITYVNESKEYILDGYQRLVSIKQFINNVYRLKDLSVLCYLNGFNYLELPDSVKHSLRYYFLGVTSVNSIEDADIYNIYNRLNRRPYEGNNIDYDGNDELRTLIEEIINYKPFQNVFNVISKEEQAEFIIRFLALYDDFESYNGNMKTFIKSYILKTKDSITLDKRRNLILIFKNTFDSCLKIFDQDAFKNCLCLQTSKGIKNVMYKSLSKPVFELQMLGVSRFSFSQIYRNSFLIKQKYEEALLQDENFKPYYKKMSKRALEYRISIWQKIIGEIVD